MMAATVGMAIGQNSDVTAEAAGSWSWTTHSKKWMSSCTSAAGCGSSPPERRGWHGAECHRHGLRRHRHLSPVSGAITQEVIDVLAVLNALRAAFPPKVIHDL